MMRSIVNSLPTRFELEEQAYRSELFIEHCLLSKVTSQRLEMSLLAKAMDINLTFEFILICIQAIFLRNLLVYLFKPK